MAKRKLLAVFLVTEEVDTLVSFYRDILQLKVSKYEPGHSAWFETGAVPLAIHRPEPAETEGSDYTPLASTIVWLQPDEDVPTVVKGLAKAGVELLQPKNAQNYIYFRDPEGRLLGLRQPR
ncbi:VOC family protein [Candidatus Acetothermia bacterium]|nr:VOC family protein [Candidatus Acetothermia bacterium]